MVGLITRLSLLAKNLTAFKSGKVAKSGNAARRGHSMPHREDVLRSPSPILLKMA